MPGNTYLPLALERELHAKEAVEIHQPICMIDETTQRQGKGEGRQSIWKLKETLSRRRSHPGGKCIMLDLEKCVSRIVQVITSGKEQSESLHYIRCYWRLESMGMWLRRTGHWVDYDGEIQDSQWKRTDRCYKVKGKTEYQQCPDGVMEWSSTLRL